MIWFRSHMRAPRSGKSAETAAVGAGGIGGIGFGFGNGTVGSSGGVGCGTGCGRGFGGLGMSPAKMIDAMVIRRGQTGVLVQASGLAWQPAEEPLTCDGDDLPSHAAPRLRRG